MTFRQQVSKVVPAMTKPVVPMIDWSQRTDSNRRPAVYELGNQAPKVLACSATPTLSRRCLPEERSPTKLARLLGVSRQRAHQLLNLDAHRARASVRKALKSGRLVKPAACDGCGTQPGRLEAHHRDYDLRLDVHWLCIPCHNIVHPHPNPAPTFGRRNGAKP